MLNFNQKNFNSLRGRRTDSSWGTKIGSCFSSRNWWVQRLRFFKRNQRRITRYYPRSEIKTFSLRDRLFRGQKRSWPIFFIAWKHKWSPFIIEGLPRSNLRVKKIFFWKKGVDHRKLLIMLYQEQKQNLRSMLRELKASKIAWPERKKKSLFSSFSPFLFLLFVLFSLSMKWSKLTSFSAVLLNKIKSLERDTKFSSPSSITRHSSRKRVTSLPEETKKKGLFNLSWIRPENLV